MNTCFITLMSQMKSMNTDNKCVMEINIITLAKYGEYHVPLV